MVSSRGPAGSTGRRRGSRRETWRTIPKAVRRTSPSGSGARAGGVPHRRAVRVRSRVTGGRAMKTLALGMAVALSLAVLCVSAAAEEFRAVGGKAEVTRSSNEKTTYDFTEAVDDMARVVIRAPRGTVTFSRETGKVFGNGSRITGAAKVLVEAEQVSFKGNIDGKAAVLVIVSKGGALEFKGRIAGEAQVCWCKAAAANPDPNTNTPPRTPA